jgi:hypothetical protein
MRTLQNSEFPEDIMPSRFGTFGIKITNSFILGANN